MDALAHLRGKIDKIDEAMLLLFEKRMNISAEIARIKKESAECIYCSDREDYILTKAEALARPELKEYSKELMMCLMNLSKSYQRDIIEGEKA